MNNTLIVVAIIVVLLLIWFAVRYRKNRQTVADAIAQICRDFGVPNRPFNVQSAVRQVESGTRPGIPRDGQWWVATGIEQIGDESRTRLLTEGTAANEAVVNMGIDDLFEQMGGTAVLPPYLQEGRYVGLLLGAHPDIIHARITGRMRPIGGWLVAVPPWLIDSK